MASGHNAAYEMFDAPEAKDPGASGTITCDRSPHVVGLVSAAAESRTLGRPTRAGKECLLYHRTDGGDITLTVTGGFNEDGETSFTFSDPGQFLLLKSVYQSAADTYVWRKASDHSIGNLASALLGILDGLGALTATAAELNARAAAASRVVNVTNAATYTVLAADSGKVHIMPDFSSSCTLALPAAATGLEYVFKSKAVAADAQNWVFQVAEAGVSFLGGLAFADTDAGAGADEIHAGVWPNGTSNDFMTIVTPGAGTRIHVINDGTNWIVDGVVYSATVPAFSDS